MGEFDIIVRPGMEDNGTAWRGDGTTSSSAPACASRLAGPSLHGEALSGASGETGLSACGTADVRSVVQYNGASAVGSLQDRRAAAELDRVWAGEAVRPDSLSVNFEMTGARVGLFSDDMSSDIVTKGEL